MSTGRLHRPILPHGIAADPGTMRQSLHPAARVSRAYHLNISMEKAIAQDAMEKASSKRKNMAVHANKKGGTRKMNRRRRTRIRSARPSSQSRRARRL